MLFVEKKLIQRLYIFAKALQTIKQVEFIDKKKFAKVILNKKFKTFIVYFIILEAFLKLSKIIIHFLQVAQLISNNFLQIAIF